MREILFQTEITLKLLIMIKNYNIFIRKKYNTVWETVSIYTFHYTFILIPFLLLHFKTRLLCRPVSGLLFIYKDSPHTCCDRSFRNDRSGCDSGFSPCFAFFFFYLGLIRFSNGFPFLLFALVFKGGDRAGRFNESYKGCVVWG